jgi:hypothetical protein
MQNSVGRRHPGERSKDDEPAMTRDIYFLKGLI